MGVHEFVHLRSYSWHTLLGSLLSPEALARAAHAAGFPALGLTDEGSLAGTVAFHEAMTALGLKPLVGVDLPVAARTPGVAPGRLALLALNREGYRNLLRLTTLAQETPALEPEVVECHNAGLVALSGGLDGEIGRLLSDDRLTEAREVAGWYREVFREARFFLEFQFYLPRHDAQRQLNRKLLELGQSLELPPVVTHPVRRDIRQSAEALVMLPELRPRGHEARPGPSFDGDQYLWTAEQIWRKWGGHLPEGLRNTQRVAELVEVFSPCAEEPLLPQFACPGGQSPERHLFHLASAGLERRLAGRSPSEAERYRTRLAMELEVILRLGYAGYLLVVQDIVGYARQRGIPVGPGRGSAAGSLVAWSLGITEIDPVAHGLVFERFLSAARKTLPDIDVDFCARRRGEVLDYIVRRYGAGHVAHIGTVGTFGARTALREVGRHLKVPPGEVEAAVQSAGDEWRGGNGTGAADPDWVRLARQVKGLPRHRSVHASGVVIAPVPLAEWVPMFPAGDDGLPVTQYGMEDLERVGLVKLDILGLKALTVLHEALDWVALETGQTVNWEQIPLDDAATLGMLARGETEGVFQFEGEGITELLREVRPRDAGELAVVGALYRPGPLDSGLVARYVARRREALEATGPDPSGKTAVSPLTGVVEAVLAETHGTPVYQEQIMGLMQKVAGYTPGQADDIRRVMAKKQKTELTVHRQQFLERGVERGFGREELERLWKQLEGFADYAFNKCLGGETAITLVDGNVLTVAELAHGAAPTGPLVTWSWDGAGWVPNEIVAVWSQGEQEVVELVLEDGRRLVCTPEHRFYTRQADGRWAWLPLWEILATGGTLWGIGDISPADSFPR